MGAYVNPVGMKSEDDKVVFLIKHGKQVTREEASKFTDFDGDELPVVSLNNGFFLVCGIAFNDREVREFTSPTDCRPREFFMVPKDVLYENSNLERYLPNEK